MLYMQFIAFDPPIPSSCARTYKEVDPEKEENLTCEYAH